MGLLNRLTRPEVTGFTVVVNSIRGEEFAMALYEIRDRRIHRGHLCPREPENPVAAQLNEIEIIAQEGSRMQRLSKIEGLDSHCRISGVSVCQKAKETRHFLQWQKLETFQIGTLLSSFSSYSI